MRWRSILRGAGLLVVAGAVLGALLLSRVTTASASTPGWQALTNPPPFDPGGMFLLTDGTVLVQDLGPTAGGSPNWWKLTPDSTGSYVDGTWTQVASMPDSYSPHAYASAVLPDGRLAIEGGEQEARVSVWSNRGAIYNPRTNTWTMVSPPSGGTGDWSKIGDAPSVVLADGRWLLGDSGSWTSADAIFDPATLTWSATTGPGRLVGNAEAAFSLLPSGKVLSVDVLPPACTTRTAEVLDPSTLVWSSAGTTPTPLVNCGDLSEIGPQILMYNGDAFVEGATSTTALYNVTNGIWSSGPSFPVIDGLQYNGQDSGEALLPDGDVLVALNSGVFQPPTHFFLFDGTSFTQVPDNSTSSLLNNGNTYMLLLPTGQVLYTPGLGGASMEVFTDSGSPSPADAPTVTSAPTDLAPGHGYVLSGLQLNGRSEGAAFGDDYQSSTDYPLVQITNDNSGAIAYARTSGMTNRSIAPGAPSCTAFVVPNGIAAGSSELRVIANGIASPPVPVTVGSGGSSTGSCPGYTLSLGKAGTGSGTVTSSAAGVDCGATCSHVYLNGTIVTLTATPATGSTFVGWSGGGCAGTGPCVVAMDGDSSVTATFSLIPETLDVSTAGDGAGAVTSAPSGIDCGASCSHAYGYGSSVTLVATAVEGSSFTGWTGDCTGTANCVLAMTAARSVGASFVKECVVPRVKHKRLSAAKRAIKAHECRVGRIRHGFSTTVKRGHVISQRPKPKKVLERGARVKLVVSRGKKR